MESRGQGKEAEYFFQRTGKKPEHATEGDRKREYVRLLELQRSRGFKEGFIAACYKSLFGEWPPREWKQQAERYLEQRGSSGQPQAQQESKRQEGPVQNDLAF